MEQASKFDCIYPGCLNKSRALRIAGYCHAHLRQKRVKGELSPLRPGVPGRKCSFESCQRKHYSNGYCDGHRKQLERGENLGPLRKRSSGDWGDWHYSSTGYVIRKKETEAGREIQYQHRLFIEQKIGRPLLKSENVHHVNGARDDNRLENLELWSHTQPKGQRVEDKVAWAKALLVQYAIEELTAEQAEGWRSKNE